MGFSAKSSHLRLARHFFTFWRKGWGKPDSPFQVQPVLGLPRDAQRFELVHERVVQLHPRTAARHVELFVFVVHLQGQSDVAGMVRHCGGERVHPPLVDGRQLDLNAKP